MLAAAPNQWTKEEAAHLLNRAGFGASPKEIQQWHALGRHQAVAQLLNTREKFEDIAPPPSMRPEVLAQEVKARREALIAFRHNAKDLSDEKKQLARREVQKQFQEKARRRGLEAQNWWIERMRQGQDPLREKMTLFWHDHFATSVQKVKEPHLLFQQNQLFRRHALGNVRELTQHVMRDPAMMLYLDLQTSKKGKPNENFAREVMELFTLGAGFYSEDDIREAARAFTGYQLNRVQGTAYQLKALWDDGEKTVLGQRGRWKGEDVVQILFQQPQCPRFFAKKLWEYFVTEDPDQTTIDQLAQTLRQSQYDLAPLLKEIFSSRAFYEPSVMHNQIKAPIVFYVQMLKQLEIERVPPIYSLYVQNQLGQILYAPPNVAGWDWGKAWINTNTLLTRYQIAGDVSQGGKSRNIAAEFQKIKGLVKRPGGMAPLTLPNYDALVPRETREHLATMVDSLVERLFQHPLNDRVRDQFLAYAEDKKGEIFTNQEVAELIHLMMSTPHYQLT